MTRIRLAVAAALMSVWASAAAAQAPLFIDLGTLGGSESRAVAINAAGQVAGWSFPANGERHAFLWDPINGMRDLGTLGGTVSEAAAINSAGKVVGWSSTASGARRAFLWDLNGMQDLGTLGGPDSEAVASNAVGQVGGSASTADNPGPIRPREGRCRRRRRTRRPVPRR